MQQQVRAIPRSNTDLDEFFLDQLRVLVARQRAAPTPRERVALSMATFSAFLDCLDLGLVVQARELLGRLLDGDAGAEGAA